MNKLAILDPNATRSTPARGDDRHEGGADDRRADARPGVHAAHPGAVREWCINTAAVDPATDSVLANSEDGKLYRWDLSHEHVHRGR